MKNKIFYNSVEDTNKNQVSIHFEKNSFKDSGDGMITFPKGLTITDDTEQHNGTRYDIKTMDISEFKNKLTVNHSDSVEDIVGITEGVRKRGSRVTIDGIKFAIQESALARFTYNMIKGGYLTDFSIETMGPWPDDEGVYYNSKLIGLSAVVVGNNKSAFINQIAKNTIEEAKKDGLDTSIVESQYLYDKDENSINQENTMKYQIVKNSRNFAVSVKYKNSAGDETEVTVQPGASVEVPEGEAAGVQDQVDKATEPTVEVTTTETETTTTAESVTKAVENAVKPLADHINKLEKQIFDNSAEEPMFKKSVSTNAVSELKDMSYKKRHAEQINAAWDMLKNHSSSAAKKLETINSFHLEALQEKGLVENSVTLEDFGNFVISPELITDIQGFRSDFAPLMSRLNFQETLSLQMAWLKRNGDVNMQEVEMCDDGANGNLKPITDYSADFQISNLKEVAGVTPVCNAATRFLAADLLGDVAQGYRTDYDRKRAQLFMVRLQQAINSTGNQIPYNKTSNVTALTSWISVMSSMQEEIMNGTYIFNQKTYGELLATAIGAGISGPLSNLFTTGDQPMLLGRPYIVVPNELMPSLNTGETKSFTVEGATTTIREAVFYTDLNVFKGRTSGGLKYDLSTEAAYEENGTVKSAFQRNELVLRGSFFRGGAVLDEDKVVGLVAAGVS